MDTCPLLPELWSVYILPQCDLVSCCLLYETCKWFMPEVNRALRARHADNLDEDWSDVPGFIRDKLVAYVPAPVFVAMFETAQHEFATLFLRDHVTPALIDWMGVSQFDIICRRDFDDYPTTHAHPFSQRLRSLAPTEVQNLCHALHRTGAFYDQRIVTFLVEAGDPSHFSPMCPGLAALGVPKEGSNELLDLAFRSGQEAMVRYVAETWNMNYHQKLPGMDPLAAACSGTDALYQAFRRLLPPCVRILGQAQDLGGLRYGSLPDMTVGAWKRMFHHVTVPAGFDWNMLLFQLAVHGNTSTVTALTFYEWLKTHREKDYQRLNARHATYNGFYQMHAVRALFKQMKADGFDVPKEAVD